MTLSRTACLALIGVVLGACLASPAQAQQPRTLSIRDGKVIIDGQTIDARRLPPGLEIGSMEAHYHFVGIEQPVVEIGDQLYAVTDRLEPISEDEVRRRNASVILRGGQQSSLQAMAPSRPGARDLQAAHQQYLSELRQHSHGLYERLMREQQMDAETRELARVIRLLPEGPERQAQIDTLRATLNRIFDLKQENRLREIEKLQQQMMELQRSLQKRERMREAMIDRRMRELIGPRAAADSLGR